MPEHTSWLNFVPGYEALEHAVSALGASWLFGNPVVVQHIAAMLLVSLFILLLSLVAHGQLVRAGNDLLPESKLSARTVVELLIEGLLSLMQFAMPFEAAMRHFRLIGTLGAFILFSNLLGLIPGFLPPTENYNVTFACASIVFIYYNAYALYKLGLGHLTHMANPVGESWGWLLSPLFFPVELISHCIRPISLSVRLLCNIAGDHLVLAVFVGLFPLILPLPFMALGLFVAVVQTFIFLLLSCVYIGEVEAMVAHHHHAEHAHAAEPTGSHADSARVMMPRAD